MDNNPNDPKSKVRRFRNPETFRQRAIRTSEDKSKPKTNNTKLKATFRLLGRPFKPLSSGYRKLKSIKQLKPLFIVLSFIGRILFPKYFRSSVSELKKVTWPSYKQSRKLTYAVLIFALVFGVAVAAVDWGLGKLFKPLLLK